MNKNEHKEIKIWKSKKKNRKSQSFIQVFGGVFIPIIIFAVTCGLIASMVAYYLIRDDKRQKFSEYVEGNNEIRGIEFSEDSKDYEQNYAKIRFQLCMSSSMSGSEQNVAAIYDCDKKQIVNSKETLTIAVKYLNTDKKEYYMCDVEEQPELLRDDLQNEKSDIGVYIDFDDIYVCKDKFLPGKGTIINAFKGTNVERDWTPENKKDYKHLMFTGSQYNALSSMQLGSTDSALELLNKLEKEDIFLGEGDDFIMYESLFGNSILYDRTDMDIMDRSYEIYHVSTYNIVKDYGAFFIIAWIILIAVVIGISLLVANRFYQKYKLQLQMDEYRRKMTNAMAHDLKSPLMVISGYAENLEENVHTEKKDYYADAIIKNTAYMNDLIEKILNLSKLENPNQVLKKELLQIRKLTNEIIEKYQKQIEEKQLKVELVGDCSLNADFELMVRVIDNLFHNAVKYTPEGCLIQICMEDRLFIITNTGVHIEQEEIEELWNPFVKGDNARSGEAGSGLGLSIVREILNAHGIMYKMTSNEDSVTVELKW